MKRIEVQILVDIQIKNRSPEQIKAQFEQKLFAFHHMVKAKLNTEGFSIRKASQKINEPEKCIITCELIGIDEKLVTDLQNQLLSFWKEIAWPDKSTDPHNAEIEYLIEELVDIGCSTHRKKPGERFFWLDNPNPTKHPRIIEIGEQLYRLGGNKLDIMRGASNRVNHAFGSFAVHDLSWHWHEIGLEEWKQGKGECWLA